MPIIPKFARKRNASSQRKSQSSFGFIHYSDYELPKYCDEPPVPGSQLPFGFIHYSDNLPSFLPPLSLL